MGHGLGHVVAACLGAMLYTGLGLFGASRIWASRFSTKTRERSPHLTILSGAMNIVSVVITLAQIATTSAGGVFPCRITSTVSHLFVLFCLLPLALRKSGDYALWVGKIVPASEPTEISAALNPRSVGLAREAAAASAKALLGTGSPLLSTNSLRYRCDISDAPLNARRELSLKNLTSPHEDQDENSSHNARAEPSAAAQVIGAKLAAVASVIMVAAVTALWIWAGGGSWSIRGRHRATDGSCFPMESWYLIASWTACATLAGISYVTTVDPRRPDPRARGGTWKIATADLEGGKPGNRESMSASVVVEDVAREAAWWLRCTEWRPQPCPLRREKLFMVLVSAWFGGAYFALLWRQQELEARQRNGYLSLLVVMNAFLLLSTFWLVAVETLSRSKPLTASDLAKLRKKWSSTKDIMCNPSVAAKFRDAARAHFCEELYKFLAAHQQFEDMNVDEDEEAHEGVGVGLAVRPFRSPLGKKAQLPEPQQPWRRSYQVPRYSAYVGIVGEFFTPGCRQEVNVSSETRLAVRKLIKFCDWVTSSEKEKRKLFIRAVREVRMMLDQNVMGTFIQSSTFAGVAQDLVETERAAKQEAASKLALEEELTRLELRNTLKRGFRTVVLANSAKNHWAKVASERSFIDEEGGNGSDTAGSSHSTAGASGAAAAPRKALPLRSVALGVRATMRYTTLRASGGDRGEREELPPLSVSVSAPPKSPTGTSGMVHVTSAPLRPTPPASPSASSAHSVSSARSTIPSLPSAVTTPRVMLASQGDPPRFGAAGLGLLATSRPAPPDRNSSG